VTIHFVPEIIPDNCRSNPLYIKVSPSTPPAPELTVEYGFKHPDSSLSRLSANDYTERKQVVERFVIEAGKPSFILA
jgi:hypothetical protein